MLANKIQALVSSINRPEIKRRKDYYEYLCEKEPQSESFEQHLTQYGRLLRTGDQASDDDIRTLEQAASFSFPLELKNFYGETGQLTLRDCLAIPSAKDLLHKLQSDAPWEKVASLGLVDIIKASWGNDRFEFDPVNNFISQAEVDALNQRYTCVGWTHDGSGEAMTYLYFDEAGRFGSVFFHQDEFDDFYVDVIVPMLSSSFATQTFSDLILSAIEPLQAKASL